MIRWLCIAHERAGLDADPACCRAALIAEGAADRFVWYRLRLAAKSLEVRNGIAMTRLDPAHARSVLVEHAVRFGKVWATGRAAA